MYVYALRLLERDLWVPQVRRIPPTAPRRCLITGSSLCTVSCRPAGNLADILARFFFFQAEDGIRDLTVTGVQTCALPICHGGPVSVRSMTGFARVRKTIPEGEIVLSAKSVNHRALDLHFHLPPELDPFEASLRKAIKGHIARGHLQIHVFFSQAVEAAAAALNKPMLAAYLSAFQQAAAEFGLSGKPDLNVALRIPGMIRGDSTPELQPEIEKVLVALMEEALETLNRFREREGFTISAEMRERCATIGEQVAEMEKIRSRATATFQKRLKERLQ